MTKVKMYCPDTMGTFKMMFGFDQPLKYIKAKRTKLKKLLKLFGLGNKVRTNTLLVYTKTTTMTCLSIRLLNY